MNTHRGYQTAAGAGLHAALHSYIHVARRANVRPYFKMGPSGATARAAGGGGGGPWNVPDLCAAYDWPTGLAGGGVIAIVELGGGWVQSDMEQFFGGINEPVPISPTCRLMGLRTLRTPDRTAPMARSRSTSRSPLLRIMLRPASPPRFACIGRRTLPLQCAPQRLMIAMYARSPGVRTRPTGVRKPATTWNRQRPPPPQPAWSCLPPRATTIRATAGQLEPTSISPPRLRM
jgi:hypothetical protein